jgi:hypothetical protein
MQEIKMTDLHTELTEFIVTILNHFASRVDGYYEWSDYFTEKDVKDWIIDQEKRADDFYNNGERILEALPF